MWNYFKRDVTQIICTKIDKLLKIFLQYLNHCMIQLNIFAFTSLHVAYSLYLNFSNNHTFSVKTGIYWLCIYLIYFIIYLF